MSSCKHDGQRITRPDFRPCLIRRSHSQARLCPYTQQLISNQPERTLGRLRYLLGGDRPSQTTRLPRSRNQIMAPVSIPDRSGWCSIGADLFSRLPPTLYRPTQNTMTGCSKAPRGLSVLRRVMRIFTHATISPSLSLRQQLSRYTIRAGRNLPDKEFRYLRTVIVTAAIHQGFSSRLPPARKAPIFPILDFRFPIERPVGTQSKIENRQSKITNALCAGMTSPVNLLALGRCQPLYVA